MLNKDGGQLYELTYSGVGADYARALAVLEGCDVAIAGWSGTEGKTSDDAWLFVVDKLGNIQWDKSFGGAANDAFAAIAVSPNGSILIGGNTATGFTVPNAWVLALDPWGNGT